MSFDSFPQSISRYNDPCIRVRVFNGNFPLILCYLIIAYNFKLNKSFQNFMCFLKFITSKPSSHLEYTPLSSFSPNVQANSSPLASPYHQHFQKMNSFSNTDTMMLNCLKMLSFNTQLIQNFEQKLISNSELLGKSHELMTGYRRINEINLIHSSQSFEEGDSTVGERLQHTSNILTTKLFGAQAYKYKLVLSDSLPDTLYKDRNFMINVKLINLATGEVQNNGNLINICLSVCDSNGEWINEAKEGGSFLKGKLQTELYHGNGEFIKLSPKDVSRHFTKKSVNLVIYAKPSLLRYSGESSMECKIDFKLIEPLIIKDISIKAKKRQ